MLVTGQILKTCTIAGGTALALLALCSGAQANTFKVVHAFNGTTDGYYSYASLLSNGKGKFYGTASAGGTSGYGTIFEVARDGTETVLHNFVYSDGDVPYGGLIRDSSGNLYGTTYQGGAYNGGVVFKLARDGVLTTLYSFTGGSDGASPESSVLMDSAGNLYGTAAYGGNGCCNGTVFEIAANGTETTLYQFTGGSDGSLPQAGVIQDNAGNLYGTTTLGGSSNNGVVFKLATNNAETVLYSFTGGADGGQPVGGLISDEAGNLYGTTSGGGTGSGVVFKVAADGTETTLYTFQGGTDGSNPEGALYLNKFGDLFGTTVSGGANGAGTVFEISAAGTESILYSFTGGSDGTGPYGSLTPYKGHLYSTTSNGGASNCPGGCGVVFSVKGK